MKLSALIFLLIASNSFAVQEYRATVVRVVDGDTVVMLIDLGEDVYKKVYVRFYKASAKEHGTKEGDAAKLALTNLLKAGAEVRLEVKGRSHGRLVSIIWQGEINVVATAVKMGICRATETSEHQ